MTRDEAMKQKLAAVAILLHLATHGWDSFANLQHALPQHDRMSLLRGIVLANSAGGLVCSIEKTHLGAVADFHVAEVIKKRMEVLRVINLQIVKSNAS